MSSSMLEADEALECLIKEDAQVLLGEAELKKDYDSTILCSDPLLGKRRMNYLCFLSTYEKHRFLVKYEPKNEILKPIDKTYQEEESQEITLTIKSKNLREELRRLFE